MPGAISACLMAGMINSSIAIVQPGLPGSSVRMRFKRLGLLYGDALTRGGKGAQATWAWTLDQGL